MKRRTKPVGDDPVEAANGALAEYFKGVNLAELRASAREDERAAEDRRLRDLG